MDMLAHELIFNEDYQEAQLLPGLEGFNEFANLYDPDRFRKPMMFKSWPMCRRVGH